jgi:hypothetical protein
LARTNFEKADLIVVVGFSFAEADVYISRMLSKSMQMNSTQKVIISDPDAAIGDKIRRKLKLSIPKFDINRVILMDGDCAKLLPKFLGSEFFKARRHKREKKPREYIERQASGVRLKH